MEPTDKVEKACLHNISRSEFKSFVFDLEETIAMGESLAAQKITFIQENEPCLKIICRYMITKTMDLTALNIMQELRKEW